MLKKAARRLLAVARVVYRREPLRCVSCLSAALVLAAAQAHLVLDPHDTGKVLAVLVPLLLGQEHARRKVTPTNGGRS